MSFFLDIFSLYVMYKITRNIYVSYHDKIFYCLAVSNLAHRVTICNMAWLLHFLTVGRYFQLAGGTCLLLQRSGGSLWLIVSKITKKVNFTSKNGTAHFFQKIILFKDLDNINCTCSTIISVRLWNFKDGGS